jgi:transposase-like protein
VLIMTGMVAISGFSALWARNSRPFITGIFKSSKMTEGGGECSKSSRASRPLAERMLNAELDHHLDNTAEAEAGNHRNGYGRKTVITDTGKLELAISRDRQGRFDPALIGKYRRRFAGFDEKIIGLYARGMTTREIAEHIGELYGTRSHPTW